MKNFKSGIFAILVLSVSCVFTGCGNVTKTTESQRPRILVSSDIGGTDPDDNQSMIHLMMYSDLFGIEGIISSPSFGNGSKEEILRMIDIYAQDYPKLKEAYPNLYSPEQLKMLCKQGRRGLADFEGYGEPTEGSQWIVECARRESDRPLWVLVWGTLEDVAQALHDAPDIEPRIRVYWIGGPNKKWGVNSYVYIAEHHPDLWIIENNATYRGFITDNKRMEYIEEYTGVKPTENPYTTGYYDYAMKGAGAMGADFLHYYKGVVKMGDSPSLFYLMNGNSNTPESESWGGQFEKTCRTARRLFKHPLSVQDTIPAYGVMEIHFQGPEIDVPADSICLTATIDRQQWAGYYLGNGDYILRYSPKAPAHLTYEIASPIAALNGLKGEFTVGLEWPGIPSPTDYLVGNNWYTDIQDPAAFEGKWQGAKVQRKWRDAILEDWKQRWDKLKD